MSRVVHVWNRKQVEAMLETPGNDHQAILISISTPGRERYGNRAGFRRVLHFQFHDSSQWEHEDTVLFDDLHAMEIIEFAQQNLHCAWHVHCDAGTSRSVAIGRALAERFNRPLKLHAAATDEFANPHVLRLMRKAAGWGY